MDREELFQVTIPAGTLQLVPVTTSCVFRDGVVTGVEMVVPPGPSGLVGFRITYGGVQQLPSTDGAYYVTDDEKIQRSINHFPTGANWEVQGYNEDINDHTIEVRFLIDELPAKMTSTMVIPTILQADQVAPSVET